MVLRIIVVIFIIVCIYYFITKKSGVSKSSPSVLSSKDAYTIDDKFNAKKVAKQSELNELLEKISEHGYNTLTEIEKIRLKELSE